jgi:hypothetical protein
VIYYDVSPLQYRDCGGVENVGLINRAVKKPSAVRSPM